jgi:hypothetical protein
MFALCPHCQFLVTVDPRSGRLPSTCPSCGGMLEDAGETAAAQDPPAPPATSDASATPETAPGTAPAPATAPASAVIPAEAGISVPERSDASAETVSGAVPAPANTNPDPDPETGDHDVATSDAVPHDPAPGTESAPDTVPMDGADVGAAEAAETAPDTVPEGADPADSGLFGEDVADELDGEAVQPEGPASLAALAVPTAGKPRPTRALPRFLDRRVAAPHAGRRAQRLTWGAIALLTLALGLQLVLADRARLSQDAQWRPLVSSLCSVFGCAIPPWHEPTAFVMLSRDVHAHPQRPGTLRVSASFRNDAQWAQPWPSLLLTLSDLDGRTAGARVFAPSDYVGADAPGLLAPGQSANVTLDVVEPAPRIVAFTFDFR